MLAVIANYCKRSKAFLTKVSICAKSLLLGQLRRNKDHLLGVSRKSAYP